MKKIIIATQLTLLLLLINSPIKAQEYEVQVIEPKSNTEFKFEREIQLEEHTKIETISFNVSEQTAHLKLNVRSIINSGKLIIEIYDSNDKKQGTFSVGNQLNSKLKELAKGNITKSLKEPEVGVWKIKLIPTNATGQVRVDVRSLIVE